MSPWRKYQILAYDTKTIDDPAMTSGDADDDLMKSEEPTNVSNAEESELPISISVLTVPSLDLLSWSWAGDGLMGKMS